MEPECATLVPVLLTSSSEPHLIKALGVGNLSMCRFLSLFSLQFFAVFIIYRWCPPPD